MSPVDPTGATLADPSRPSATADSGLAGKLLAHFRLERRLGRGGMGEVYLATDLALERPVAVKVLGDDVAADPGLRQRFLREARAQARLQHPNVCHIYFIGEQDDRLFFAMELIDGESLQARLDRDGRLPAGEAVELCRQAALGLREAHRQGITHRDVKPSNLMVDRNGSVKVVDFGLAKHTGIAGAADVSLTVDKGSILGTPLYLAPEQARGEAVDFRTDVYSLGATLHHLVSGAPPFTADTALGVVAKHLSEPRPPLEPSRRRLGRSAVDALVDRMMAKRPQDRFASTEDLLAEMERVSPAITRPAGFWVRSFALAVDLVVVLLLGLPLRALGVVHGDRLLPALAAGYFVLAHALWGRTLGKAALDIEVVSRDRAGPPPLERAALRWLALWAPLLVSMAAAWLVPEGPEHSLRRTVTGATIVLFAFVPQLVSGALAARAADKRTFWDRAGRTLVRYRPATPPAAGR